MVIAISSVVNLSSDKITAPLVGMLLKITLSQSVISGGELFGMKFTAYNQ
jgi:hypothetical protein